MTASSSLINSVFCAIVTKLELEVELRFQSKKLFKIPYKLFTLKQFIAHQALPIMIIIKLMNIEHVCIFFSS